MQMKAPKHRKMFDNLDDTNYILYAEESYRNPQCVCYDDFLDDLNRIKYVKRLFNKYERSGEFKDRLILNHVIAFYNVFEHYPATRIWFTKINRKHWGVLNSVLTFLGYMPRVIHGINGVNLLSDDLPIDEDIYGKLKEL